MTVSNEAVEAAMKYFPQIYRSAMANALTAAAPLIAAQAWDEGYTTGNAHNGRRDANPYRSHA